MGDETVNYGDMTMLNCMVPKGDLPLKIYWTLNGKSVDQIGGITVMYPKKRISQLTIDDIKDYHAGEYTCIAQNHAGNETYSAELHVNGII